MRLGSYSRGPIDAFVRALMAMPSHEIDKCLAYDDCPSSPTAGTSHTSSCDEGRYVPTFPPTVSTSFKNAPSPRESTRTSTPPPSPPRGLASRSPYDTFTKATASDCGSSSTAEPQRNRYSTSDSAFKQPPEFGCSYADLEAKVAELQSRLDNAETRASLAEERAKVTMLQAQLEKAEARAALAEELQTLADKRADVLEARLASLEGRSESTSPAPSGRRSLKPGSRLDGHNRSLESHWQWEACSASASAPMRTRSNERSNMPGGQSVRRAPEALAFNVTASHTLQRSQGRCSPRPSGSPTHRRHPGHSTIAGRPLFSNF